jgi:hypothetical protein
MALVRAEDGEEVVGWDEIWRNFPAIVAALAPLIAVPAVHDVLFPLGPVSL